MTAAAAPWRVLVSAPYLLPVLDQFRGPLERAGLELVIASVSERLGETELLKFAGQVDAAVCGDDQFSASVLQAFSPRLKVISKWGTGVDSIDGEGAGRLGIRVFNTPGAFTDAVADSALGYILAFARSQPWMDRALKSGRWEKTPARALAECSLGVVGVGRIGKAVLTRARAFGMALYGNDIVQIAPFLVRQLGVRMVGLKELCRQADFVSLNCDLNPTSHHLIDATTLEWMRPAAVIINTARGPVIEEGALIEALKAGRIAGAALDVFEDEPLAADSPLRAMDQVLLGAHNANSSPEAWQRVHLNTLRNLLLGLDLDIPAEWGERPRKSRRSPRQVARTGGRKVK